MKGWKRLYRTTMVGGPGGGRTRRECWSATSADGIWHVERLETSGTPWALIHLPTRTECGLFSTLKRAMRPVDEGEAYGYLVEARQEAEQARKAARKAAR